MIMKAGARLFEQAIVRFFSSSRSLAMNIPLNPQKQAAHGDNANRGLVTNPPAIKIGSRSSCVPGSSRGET